MAGLIFHLVKFSRFHRIVILILILMLLCRITRFA